MLIFGILTTEVYKHVRWIWYELRIANRLVLVLSEKSETSMMFRAHWTFLLVESHHRTMYYDLARTCPDTIKVANAFNMKVPFEDWKHTLFWLTEVITCPFGCQCRAERQQWAHKVEKLVLDEVQHWHESWKEHSTGLSQYIMWIFSNLRHSVLDRTAWVMRMHLGMDSSPSCSCWPKWHLED